MIARFQFLRIVVGVLAIVGFGCDIRRVPDPDVTLVGRYVLGSYESVDNDGYFVARGGQVVVSSSIREIGVVDHIIVGRVEDMMVGAMERISDGYFLLDASSGELLAGLSRAELEVALGVDVEPLLVAPSDWKP